MKLPFCLLSLLALALTSRAQDSTEAMLNYAASNPAGDSAYSPIYSNINGPIGWTFQPTTEIDVTALGAFAYLVPRAGLEVGLWDSSGDLLASATINTAGTAVDQSLYQSFTPVALTANQTYYLAAYYPGGYLSAIVVTPDTAPNGYATMSPEIQLGEVAYSANSGFAFPSTTDGHPGDAIIAPNFEFQSVPEPSTLFLLGGGAIVALINRRLIKSAAVNA